MYIDEKTAQLILDAIAWSNADWLDSLGWDSTKDGQISDARIDFLRFCRARGIEGVEKTTTSWVEDA